MSIVGENDGTVDMAGYTRRRDEEDEGAAGMSTGLTVVFRVSVKKSPTKSLH